jgi:hypothetical protein
MELNMHIQEYVSTRPTSVADGLIKDCHILGFKSRNGREYARTAVEQAIPLYEGMAVYVNHAPGQPRTAEDRFGKLLNVRLTDDGLRGDLQYLTEHPMATRVQEDLTKNLNFFGLSHDADGKGIRRGRKTVIESIAKVHSVDLVSGAATVEGLLEQQDAVEELEEPAAAEVAEETAQEADVEELAPDHKLVMDITKILGDAAMAPEDKRAQILELLDAHLKLSLALEIVEETVEPTEVT